MEPKFIELHDGADPLSINVELVEWFADETISMTNCEHRVLESYDEIKQLIKDSGILIHRADPRLDTTTPLTMVDLKDMIGEPVWNSNNGFWYLVNSIQTDPDGSHEKIILRTTKGRIELLFDEDELIKFPLYRMRREK